MTSKLFAVMLLLTISAIGTKAERPARCLEPHPKGYGVCDMLISGYHYNVELNACQPWSEGGCGTRGGHSYYSWTECQQECVNAV